MALRMTTMQALVLGGILLPCLVPSASAQSCGTTRAASAGSNWVKTQVQPLAVSANGRWVLGSSDLSLVAGDMNSKTDVYLLDRTTNAYELISVTPSGSSATEASQPVGLSPDARFVLFHAYDTNLVPGDNNGSNDVFLRDRLLQTTELVSTSSAGQLGQSGATGITVTPDGRFVLFVSRSSNLVPGDANGEDDVFLRDRTLGSTILVSTTPAGVPGAGSSRGIQVTDNGRFVLFSSSAPDLVSNDSNGLIDVFVRDTVSGTTIAASRALNGQTASGDSEAVGVSQDGRYVCFNTWAADIVTGDLTFTFDGFLRDLQSGTTQCITTPSTLAFVNQHAWALSMSEDGAYVLISTSRIMTANDANNDWDLYRVAVGTSVAECASLGANGIPVGGQYITQPSPNRLSVNGSRAWFSSSQSVVAPSMDANGALDIFIHEFSTGTSSCASLTTNGTTGNHGGYKVGASRDLGFVICGTNSTDIFSPNFPPIYCPGDLFIVRDVLAGATTILPSVPSTGGFPVGTSIQSRPAISQDGSLIASEVQQQLVVADRSSDISVVVGAYLMQTGYGLSMSADGAYIVTGDCQGPGLFGPIMLSNYPSGVSLQITTGSCPRISADGNYVCYVDNPGRVFVMPRMGGASTPVSIPSGASPFVTPENGWSPSISTDGRFIAFESTSSVLEVGDTNNRRDIFIHDRITASTWRSSVASNGSEANGDSSSPWISGNGRYVVFESVASNLIVGDNNATQDIFVRDRMTGTTTLVSKSSAGVQGNRWSGGPAISADGRYVTFYSLANNLVPNDGNRLADVFGHDLLTGATRRLSVATECTESDGYSASPSPMVGGRWTAFASLASNLVAGTSTGHANAFLRDCSLDSDCGLATGVPFCFGDGSGAACPCGNSGPSGYGCASSLVPTGATLTGSGYPSVLDDSLRLTVAHSIPLGAMLFFQGTMQASGGAGVGFGDGKLCVTGTNVRLGVRFADAAGSASTGYGANGTLSLAVAGLIPVGGAIRHYQAWYRDAAVFCQSDTYNLTNGYTITWSY